jgi:hypothetical protein
MSTNVREILDRIGRLSEDELAELRNDLARQEEQEWFNLVRDARREARQRGLDDEAIARVVEESRYGKEPESR